MSNATEETLREIADALTPAEGPATAGPLVSQAGTAIGPGEGAWWVRLDTQPGDTGTSGNPLFVMSPSPLVDSDAGTVTKKLVLTGARKLRGFIVTNNQLTTYYFMVVNKATAPVAGDAPGVGGLSIQMPAGSMLGVGADVLSDQGIDLTLGLGWAWSSTAATFTDAGTNSLHSTVILYK